MKKYKNKDTYLNMQLSHYNQRANDWSIDNRNPVVGSYQEHNDFKDYDTYLFDGIDTSNLKALDYGSGPGRNLIRFNNRFKEIDGVDISPVNKEKAEINLADAGIPFPNYYVTSGDNIPVNDSTYDVIFSTICLQHICCHEIRFNIMKDVYRTLKAGGIFCAQMGMGGKVVKGEKMSVNYYENKYDAKSTNGKMDVSIEKEKYLITDLHKIGFDRYKSHIGKTGPGDNHKNWIWFQARKP